MARDRVFDVVRWRGGGSWTPAAAMGDLLLDRPTANAGMSSEFEPSSTGAGHHLVAAAER